MQLFHEWKDSFLIFFPRNVRIFGLAALNAAWQAYKVWLSLFWPLFVLYGLVGFVALFSVRSFTLLLAMLRFGLFFSLILSVRPSVARKTWAYVSGYWLHGVMLGVFFFIDYFVSLEHLAQPMLTAYLFSPFFSLVLATGVLFYCDTMGRLRDYFLAWWRAIKLIWYGLPFYGVVFVVAGVCYIILAQLVSTLFYGAELIARGAVFNQVYTVFFSLFAQLVFVLFSLIPISWIAIFYTKKIHDYSERFFG